MKKRGSGHIDVIIGFIIFALAISLAVYYFKPISSERVEESALSYVTDKIYKNISIKLETYPVSIVKSSLPSSQIIAFDLDINLENDENIFTTDEFGSILDYDLDANKINLDWGGSDFVIIHIAEGLDDNSKSLASAEVNESYYRIGASRTSTVISEKNLLLLNESYYNSYQEMKKYFNLPARINFGFSFSLLSGRNIVASIPINNRGEVFSRSQRVEILNSSGYKEIGEMRLELW